MNHKSYFIGIDTGRLSIFYGIVDFKGQKIGLAEEISNDESGFKKIFRDLKDQGISVEEVVFCIENTGVYSEKIGFFLYEKGCFVSYRVHSHMFLIKITIPCFLGLVIWKSILKIKIGNDTWGV